MITEIRLQHFKCFEKLNLSLRPLTLLTGVNAGGKSSVIQSLLLLKQSRAALQPPGELFLRLNGTDASLGTVADVVDESTARDTFTIGLSDEIIGFDVTCKIETKDALAAPVKSMTLTKGGASGAVGGWPERSDGPWTLLTQLLHVSTERIGPRETYNADTAAPEDAWHLGPKGEFTAWLLHQRADADVAPQLCREGAPPKLMRQVEAWMGVFFPGTGLEVKRIPGTNLLTMRLRTSPSGSFHRPENVGYGLTHILPIIVGALATATDGILVVENPETHLHPSAQAMMGQFLARVAGAGRQVIIESHSDHILNGLRRSVKEGVIDYTATCIHFFNKRPHQPSDPPHVISPEINGAGRINHWPNGFFDQYEKDLDELTSWD